MYRYKYYILVIHFFLLAACTLAPPRYESLEPLPKAVPNSDLDCPITDESHCSIESPIQEFAEQLINKGNVELHYANILDIGVDALVIRIHLIRAAREFIDMQTFIWQDDEVGHLIAGELLAAARRGVKVRIIGDQLNIGRDPERLAQVAVANKNLKVKLYNPIHRKATITKGDFIHGIFFKFDYLNHRMHNKIIVIDGRIGITGGRNIGNKYHDWDPEFNFIDRDVLIIGPVVKAMGESFEKYWTNPISVDLDQLTDVNEKLFSDGKQIPLSLPAFRDISEFNDLISQALDPIYIQSRFIEKSYPVNNVRFAADRPQKPFIPVEEIDIKHTHQLKQLVENANRSVLIQTPYFIISNPAYQLFRELREQHPDIRLSASTNSLASADHYYVHALSYKRKKRNIKHLRFNIYELKPVPIDVEKFIPRYQALVIQKNNLHLENPGVYDPEEPAEFDRFETVPISATGPRTSIHAKSMVIDDKIAVIGSHNFDPRGIAINTEITLTIVDDEFAQALKKNIKLATAPQNSWIIAKQQKVPIIGHISNFIASISRMLPVLDIWPFRYSASFELRDGKQPVEKDDPAFYDYYQNVGQFPRTTLGNKQFKTLMVSAFGAVAEPLM